MLSQKSTYQMSITCGLKNVIAMTECFWCNETFDSTDHDSCPSCARDTHTKEITIIKGDDDDSEEDI
jgi:rRNA maturation endonuclease Nob1